MIEGFEFGFGCAVGVIAAIGIIGFVGSLFVILTCILGEIKDRLL